MFKKLLISFLIGTTFLFSLAPFSQAKAEATWYDQSFQEWYGKVYDTSNPSEIFGERYTAAQVQWIIYSLFAFVIPDKPTVQCIMSGDLTSCLDQIKGLLGIADAGVNFKAPTKQESLASLVFSSNRPLSFISYAKNLGNKMSLVSEVHAQTPGFGFDALKTIQSLWVASRNIVYGLLVLIAIILAFMIMFRMKIAPQVVISIQSAIPKILIALILVTFSYAIAGLLVDLMYVVTGIISLAISGVGGDIFVKDPAAIFKFMTTGFVGINSQIGVSVGIFGVLIFYLFIFTIALFLALFAAGGGVVGLLATLGIMGGVVSLMAIIALVIMIIVVLFTTFKIWWMLIKAFAQILLLTIAAPFQIAFGAIIPSMGFGSWLKSMVANLAVFPITGLFLILSFVFLMISTQYSIPGISFDWWKLLYIIPGGGGFSGLASNTGWPPLLGSSDAMLGLIFVGASVMVLTLIPKVAEIIKGAISGKPFAYGSAIGEAWGSMKGVGGFAYDQSGLRDYFGTIGAVRKARRQAEIFRQGTVTEKVGTTLVGGDKTAARNALQGTSEGMSEKAGYQKKPRP
ncbi:MAG: hypothetical protein US68_C0040G0001 [Candidatus Shapirobacteria bacterium GW2011_GWE1_38_10]|uniref:TrbL/VirB6 plasmid conjugal transfer protein n=1 Tax=Candidatus Shapirobacteria bacterium GW2011_GWE1_38_10 TaxID=1618488 RepID=A0A0G0KGB5_9BACT|nr:MAG: hypothetical protein US68_C0040G0001 [Candidatus Shapirobacteria bacterium GW2011_GWE1_38_10]